MTPLEELLERVKGATGPDRELDEAIALSLCDEHHFMQLADAPAGVGCEMYRFGPRGFHSALRVTASLDAALALCERVLPGWWPAVRCLGHYWEAEMSKDTGGRFLLADDVDRYGTAPTPALALIAAMLSAKLSQDTQP